MCGERSLSQVWCSVTAPLVPDAAYMGLVLPMPGDMSAGRLVNDNDALPPGVADDEEGTSESRSAPLFTDAGVGTGCQAAVASELTAQRGL